MNIFADLEGLRGEQLATAALRMLVLRSAPCRAAFISLLDGLSPHGPLAARSHFSCYTEYGTADDAYGRGRLDLVIELDDCIVGLEVKLFAVLQPSQPAKYAQELTRVAKHLTEIRGRRVRHFLVVVAPESREAKITNKLGREQRFLSWEDVLKAMQHTVGRDPFVDVLIDELAVFLYERLDFLPRFSEWSHHLSQHWEPGGSAYHRTVLTRLWDILPNPARRLGSTDNWVGYSFYPDGEDGGGARSWLGFVATSTVSDPPDRKAALVVQSPRTDLVPGPFCRPVTFGDPHMVDRGCSSWEVTFDSTWNSPAAWTEPLRPFL